MHSMRYPVEMGTSPRTHLQMRNYGLLLEVLAENLLSQMVYPLTYWRSSPMSPSRKLVTWSASAMPKETCPPPSYIHKQSTCIRAWANGKT